MNTNGKNIPGWGVDADPENEPTYPMKDYTGDDHKRINWVRPQLQQSKVEILKSIERPTLSAVFGTTLPPSGFSGVIRRLAFKYSETRFVHWFALLIADRVNVVEGVFSDLLHGRIPNVYAEKGWKADMKFQRGKFVLNIALRLVIVAAIALLVAWLISEGRDRPDYD